VPRDQPASQLALKRQALIQQLDGIGACHTPDLRAHADSTALVRAGDGLPFDKVMKHRAGTG